MSTPTPAVTRPPVLTYRSLIVAIAAVLLVVGIVLYVVVGHALNPVQLFFIVAGCVGVGGAWWLVVRMVLEQRRDARGG